VGNSGGIVDVSGVYISDYTGSATGQTTVGNIVGYPNGATINADNVFYNTDTTVLLGSGSGVTPTTGEGLLTAEITQSWFDSSVFATDFFKYLDISIARNMVTEGPVVPIGFSVISANVKKYYLIGEALDLSELRVYLNYSDATSELLDPSSYTVDSAAFDNTLAGTYPIVITYDDVSKSFAVDVVSVDSVRVDTLFFQDTYLLNANLDLTGLYVKAVLSDGNELALDPGQYNIDTSGFDNLRVGVCQMYVTFGDFPEAVIDIHVTPDQLVTTDNHAYITVDQEGEYSSGEYVSGSHRFTSLKSALAFIDNVEAPAEVVKILYVHAGTYQEKLTIAVANLIMIGEDRDTTIITYDAAAGLKNPAGSTWGTQGSASVAIKSSAVNFMAKDITFANGFDYNSATFADTQAVSLVNEADKVIFTNVAFKGFQDTLYAKYGRQYYYDVYIEGVVDFIFGNGGPAFFEASTIKSLARSTGCLSTNKGYTTSADMLLDYGYVFYHNELIYEEGVPSGSVDLGRPWAADAAIAYIENTFGSHISARGWTEMSGNLPENARFYEYGNLDDALELLPTTTNGKTLTEAEALIYADKDVIFAKTNGMMDFGTEWDYAADLARLLLEPFVG